MNNTKEQFVAHAINKGWDSTLIDSLIELAGGFNGLCEHTALADKLIFMNSMSGRPDLEDDEPSAICSSVVLADVPFLGESNTDLLAIFFKAHYEIIKTSLIQYAKNTNTDAMTEFMHLTQQLDGDEDAQVWGDGDLSNESMRYAVITVYYHLLTMMVELQDGFNAARLSELDLSKVNSFQCIDTQLIFECKPSVKQIGFVGDNELLQKIYDTHYIEFMFSGSGKKKHINYVIIHPKDKNIKRFPVSYACKKIGFFMVDGASFVEADIVNKTKNDIDIAVFNESMLDMTISTSKEIELYIAGSGIVVAAGECMSAEIEMQDNAQLLATKLKVKDRAFARCIGENTVFINSDVFHWERSKREVKNMVVNNGVVPIDPSYIDYLKGNL